VSPKDTYNRWRQIPKKQREGEHVLVRVVSENVDDGKMVKTVLEHEIDERVVMLATTRPSFSKSQNSGIATTRTTAKL
jgi:hypothetical protein